MFKRIVVGLGKSKTGQLAAERAAVLATALGATLHVVTAFKPGQKDSARDRPEAERLLSSFAAGKPCTVATDALPGDPVRAILQVADESGADLIVVGNKGMRGAGRLLGSVPNSVTHKAPCSVGEDELTRQASRWTVSGANAGTHTATYSAPSGPGEL